MSTAFPCSFCADADAITVCGANAACICLRCATVAAHILTSHEVLQNFKLEDATSETESERRK